MRAHVCFLGLLGAAVVIGGVVACGDDDNASSTTDAGTIDSSTTDSGVVSSDGGTAVTQEVVDAANAFLASLTTAQQATANIAFTQQAAETWTNLPGGNRNGVQYQDMSTAAQAAALNLAQVALGADGYTEMNNIRNADSVIASTTSGNSGWGAGLTHFAILGTPSLTAVWMLQICAHHLVYNIVYNGNMISATPVFLGTEPPNWSLLADGTTTLVTGVANGSTVNFVNGKQSTDAVDTTGATAYAALEPQRAAVDALLTAILADSTATSAAKLTSSFTDVVYGIASSGGDYNYPFSTAAGDTVVFPSGTTGRGALYSTLSAAAQADVKTAIEAWVNTQATGITTPLLAAYESDDALAQTYVGYGAPSSGTPSFMANPNLQGNAAQNYQGSYIRIDGPRLLIEFVVQEAVAFQAEGWVHYHSIWRDKDADYGAEFKTGISVDAGTGGGGGGPGGDGGGAGGDGGGPGGEGGPGGPGAP